MPAHSAPQRQPTPDQAAAMPPALWLTGVLGPRRRDQMAIRWAADPDLLLPLPTGVRWDTVRIPAEIGSAVLTELLALGPERIGPVLLNADTDHTYWLTMPGTQPDGVWSRLHPAVELLEPGTAINMPDPSPDPLLAHFAQPREVPELVTWAHWPAITGTLTPPVWLAGALASHRRNSALRSTA